MRKELGIPLGAKVILSVGEVNKNKNHKVGIKALAKLNDKNIYYVVCGRGPLMEAHKELAYKLGVGNQVVFTGYRTDVADFYKMANVFLFPSLREGLPVAVMEAMANGLPVVATKIRGSSDMVVNGENGILLNPTDVDGFAKAILEFSNQEKRELFSKRNCCKARNFDLQTVIEFYKTVYFENEL